MVNNINRSKQHQNEEHIEDPEVASFLGSDSLTISHEIEVSYLVNSLLRFQTDQHLHHHPLISLDEANQITACKASDEEVILNN